jgi:iron complex outermembrane receptor protein
VYNKLSYWGILLILLFATIANSQTLTLKGTVTNSETTLPLPNCNIFIEQLDIGTITNANGFYLIENLNENNLSISASFVGFKTVTEKINLENNFNLNFELHPEDILLSETIVKASRAELRETPIAFSEKSNRDVERELGSQDVPHILQSTPSIFISQQGGGTGDLRMNMRGFEHTHFAVMINGIPINNPENGEVYWSNWSGISDVVENIQVQRGLTANPYSSTAVGGLVNIQTVGVNSNNNFVKVRSEIGADNFRKFSVAFNNHIIPGKFAITGLLSKKTWDGYADQTPLSEYTYYLGVGGIFGNHSLELQAIGSPQEHGQRMTLQSISTWEQRGKRYNADWGFLQGEPLNIRDNEYHNPTINLNHNWQINGNLLMSNLLYFVPGKGGGTVPPWVAFGITVDGQIDFDKEYQHNSNNIDSAFSSTLNKTENALRFFDHTHQWFGFLSTMKYSTNYSTFTFGIDYRYYKANNNQRVSNLLGGDYTIGWAGFDNMNEYPLYEGDKIDFDADSFAKHFGGFIQYEFNNKLYSFYINTTLSHTSYNRIDYFNYVINDPNRETGWENFLGYSLKSGLNHNFNLHNNIYLNFGIISKPPLAYNVFDFSNKKFNNVTNEDVLSVELGYGFNKNNFLLNINTFYTIWKNKAFNKTQQDWTTGQFFFYNISGADSRHMGLELESKYIINTNFSAIGMLSISENIFTSNAITAKSPEDNPTNVEYSTSYVNDTFLPRFPMTTANLAFVYSRKVNSNLSVFVKPEVNYIANQYAQFDFTAREDQNEEGVNSWKLPNYSIANFHFGIEYSFNNLFINNIDLTFNLFNAFNNNSYIIDAIDGTDHSKQNALVWYGRERWWNISIAISF